MEPIDEEGLLEFLYACPVGLIDCDVGGEIRLINPNAMQHMLPLAGARGASNLFVALDQHAPELRDMTTGFAPPSGRICDGHRIFMDQGRRGRHDRPKVISCTLTKLGPDRLIATLTDISEQVAQELRLERVNTWFSAVVTSVNDYALLSTCKNGIIRSVNRSFTGQTGREAAEVIGQPLTAVLTYTKGQINGFDEQFDIAELEGWSLSESWEQRANGQRYMCQRLIVKQNDGGEMGEPGFVVVLRDVNARDDSQDLQRALTHDHLTGAANRMHFRQALQREHSSWVKQRRRLSLVLLDLDHFKAVNDKYGHPAGDKLLRAVAERSQNIIPPNATFARLGGEEFGAILPRFGLEEAVDLADTLRGQIADLIVPVDDGIVTITASFGCASLAEVDGSIDELIALADRRLYTAKRNGRNRVWAAAA